MRPKIKIPPQTMQKLDSLFKKQVDITKADLNKIIDQEKDFTFKENYYDKIKFNPNKKIELIFRPITGLQAKMMINDLAKSKGININPNNVWESFDILSEKFPELNNTFKKVKDSLGAESFQIGIPGVPYGKKTI